jgi:hypothetical protein
MASLVLLNVPQILFEEIKEWGRSRRINTDDAAIELLKLAVESIRRTSGQPGDEKKALSN